MALIIFMAKGIEISDSNQYSENTWFLSNKIVEETLLKISKINGPPLLQT